MSLTTTDLVKLVSQNKYIHIRVWVYTKLMIIIKRYKIINYYVKETYFERKYKKIFTDDAHYY